MPLGFYFDNTRCTGCRTCAIACADYRDLPAGRRFRRVLDVEGGATEEPADGTVTTTAFAYHVSVACNHCNEPACARVCPTGAMHRDDLGRVRVDAHRCIGCGYCTIACPYHAPAIDPTTGQSSKCDGCAERVAVGKRPICVEACPLRALDFGDVAALGATHPGCARQVTPLPDASLTDPNLLVLPSEAAVRAAGSGGVISNPREITNDAQDT